MARGKRTLTHESTAPDGRYVVMRTARGRVNHYAREEEMNAALCGAFVIAPPDSVTAWTLCEKCARIAEADAR